MAEDEVASQTTLDPFSSLKLVLFHSTTPCCRKCGKFSYANCNFANNSSFAVFSLLARIAQLTDWLKVT